jgi:hypothetical protein
MWIVGTVLLLAVAILLILFIAHWSPPAENRPVWHVPQVAMMYTGIVGTLAGFVIASSFFLANLIDDTNSSELETVIGMLLIGFFVLIGTAQTYGTTPNHPDGLAGTNAEDIFVVVQKTIFLVAHINYYMGIMLAWLSLRPLAITIGLPTVAAILTWVLFFVVLAGAGRLGMHLFSLTTMGRLPTLLIPIIGLVLTSLYRLVLVPSLPALWPKFHPSLSYAVCAFILTAAAFMASSQLVMRLASPEGKPSFLVSERVLLVYIQIVVCSIFLVWYSVAI